MSAAFWKQFPAVGYASMEQEHRRLAKFIAELHESARAGVSFFAVEDTLRRLIEYSRKHFAEEEKLMRESRYPAFVEHRAQHERIYLELEKLMDRLRRGSAVFSSDVVMVVKQWLSAHIERCDIPLSDHLSSQTKP